MKVKLDYGKEGLEVEIPDRHVVGVLTIQSIPPLVDPAEAVRSSLANPIGSRSLEAIARGRKDACIVVCDVTRPVPNPVILPEILAALDRAGMDRACIKILVATGTHRPNVGEELVRMIGQEAATVGEVINNVCTDDDDFKYLGESANGVPIHLNRHYLDADLKITVGMIEPHFMAGYAGGRKMVMPGIASLRTIQAWHSPRFLEHPNATMGITTGNPVHEESLAIARLARPDFMIDVVLDVQKRACAFFAGDMEAAWEAGVAFVAPLVHDHVSAPVDIVVTTCGGFPLDLTFYQTVKGMVGALPIVKRGGTIILASAMTEGVGLPHFKEALLATVDIAAYPETIQRSDWTFVGDQWQIEELSKAVRHAEVWLQCEGIDDELLSRLFVRPIHSVEHAVREAIDKHGPEATIAVIPKGPYVIPSIKS